MASGREKRSKNERWALLLRTMGEAPRGDGGRRSDGEEGPCGGDAETGRAREAQLASWAVLVHSGSEGVGDDYITAGAHTAECVGASSRGRTDRSEGALAGAPEPADAVAARAAAAEFSPSADQQS